MKDERFNKAVGIYLKRVRDDRGFTQNEIDDGLGKRHGWYRELERGRNSLLFGDAQKLCAFLDIDIDEMGEICRDIAEKMGDGL